MKSIFISRLYEDKKHADNLKKWQTRGLLDGYTITFETKDLRNQGENAIKEYLKRKVNGATALLVLVGDDTHNHKWIKYEVDLANSYHKKVFWMRIPNTTGAKPAILNNAKELEYNANQIVKYIK